MELVDAATLPFLALISAVVLVCTLSRKLSPRPRKRPPGPWRLPLIGNLHQLMTSQPHVALRDLARKHGPVMYLRLGEIDAVVISSPAAAKEVLSDKDVTFAWRPNLLVADVIMYGKMDIAFAPYGAYWRMLRRLCTVELLSTHKVRQLEHVRHSETFSLVRKVSAAGEGGEPVNLGSLLVSCSTAITGRAMVGQQLCAGELMSVVDVAMRYGAGFCAGDLYPSLWFVDVVTGLTRRFWRARRKLDAIFDKLIAEFEATRQGDATTTTTAEGGLLSALLTIKQEQDESKGELKTAISSISIKAILFDMLAGGIETTSSAAEWIMSELMRNPEVMAKAQAEVRQALDGKSPQEHEAQMETLGYTRMVMKEGMRLHPVAPFLVRRLCQETCDIGGFEVTKGSKVIVNAWALARSPEHWQDPEEFRPERFERSAADYKGSQFEYLPFGSGRRMCPGNTFGLAALELMVARLLYYFDWSLPDGIRPDGLDMDAVFGLSMRKKNHLHLVASLHNELPTDDPSLAI